MASTEELPSDGRELFCARRVQYTQTGNLVINHTLTMIDIILVNCWVVLVGVDSEKLYFIRDGKLKPLPTSTSKMQEREREPTYL